MRVKSACAVCGLPLEAEDDATIAHMLAAHQEQSPGCGTA